MFSYVLTAATLILLMNEADSQAPGLEGHVTRDPTKPIKCFICNQISDEGCADWFDNSTYTIYDCTGKEKGATMCYKVVQEVWYDGKWDLRYIRGCATRGQVGADQGRWCTDRVGNWRVKVKYCFCDNKDGCNAGPSVRPSPSGLFLTQLLLPALCTLQRAAFRFLFAFS